MVTKKYFKELSHQFRCPSGVVGKQVGKRMDKLNDSQNNWVISLLNLCDVDRVLEIGFGTGRTLGKVSNIISLSKIYGIELSETMLKVAEKSLKKKIESGSVELQVVKSDVYPYSNNFFTKVFAVHVVYFWNDLISVFSEIFRVTSKKGLLALYFVSPIIFPSKEFHEYDEKEIILNLSNVGFQDIQVRYKKFGRQNGICILATKY